jgi:subtilisin-like proprotein convertase family protein
MGAMGKYKFFLLTTILSIFTLLYAGSEVASDEPAGGIAINDNSCFDRTFTISSSSTISNVKFKIDIEHTWRGDLDITLTSPAGTSVDLTSDNGGYADNLSVIFDDSAAETITGDSDDQNLGSFVPRQPEGSLEGFKGENPQGDWTLTICDDAGGDTGTYNEAMLIIYWETDTDGDGVPDNMDVDDDNDGILDVDESILDKTVFELHGDAVQLSDSEVQLTSDANNQYGTSMSINTVDLMHNFSIDVELYLGTNDGGADGISFVLHNDPDGSSAIGTGEGSTLGSMANDTVVGIRNGLSIEFDTYQSASGSDDPTDDHTQIRDTDYSFDDTAGRVTDVTALSNLEDGNWHAVHLEWDAAASELSYTIDGIEMPGITDSDLAVHYFDGSSDVYFGFTAATGGLNNVQKIRNVFSSSLKDSDLDGISNAFDLDSDNDGIPDNIEAQPTGSYIAPSGIDTDGDGLDDAYDPDDGGTAMSLPDTDGDSIPDYIDPDSDNDGYTDCEEGIDPSVVSPVCPVDSANVGVNGLVNWADNGDDYTDVSGVVTNLSSDLFNETGDNSEVGYREFLCGKNLITLTRRNWKLISVPCKTANVGVEALFGSILGPYGEPSEGGQWIMYQQSALVDNDPNNDNFEINDTHTNTNKTKLTKDSLLLQGVSYWIIWDDGQGTAEVNVTIDKTLSGLAPTAAYDGSSLNDPDVSRVFYSGVPDNDVNNASTRYKKYMGGNPYPYAFEIKHLYFSHGYNSGGAYYPMGDTNNDTYIDSTFYKHDSPELGPVTGYKAVNAATPGFDNGGIKAMEGFFMKIEKIEGDTTSNEFAYPLMMRNGSGN